MRTDGKAIAKVARLHATTTTPNLGEDVPSSQHARATGHGATGRLGYNFGVSRGGPVQVTDCSGQVGCSISNGQRCQDRNVTGREDHHVILRELCVLLSQSQI